MTDLLTLALGDIDRDAFPRDRTFVADAAFEELVLSILRDGLRQPVEVCAIEGDTPFALISGYRRLRAVARLHDDGLPGFDTVAAFLRRPADASAALTLMIGENEVRADLAPWDRGRIVWNAVQHGYYETLDAAVVGLHPAADRAKRARLRNLAAVVQEFENVLTEPQSYSQAKLLRIAAACRQDFTELMIDALCDSRQDDPTSQWQTLDRIMTEAELAQRDPARLADDTRVGYPRRRIRARRGLVIRRELAPDGWTLRFTGHEATGRLMQDVMDYVEQNFGRD